MKEKSALAVEVGEKVRRLRRERGRSQEDFADDCGIHRTYMGAIERGERVISIAIALRVARELGLTLAQFFEGVGVGG